MTTPMPKVVSKPSNLVKDLRWALPPYTRGQGIAICSTPVKALYSHIVTVNEEPYTFNGQLTNPDFLVKDISNLPLFSSKSLDFVVCNIFYPDNGMHKPLKEYWRLIKDNGNLIVFTKTEDPEMLDALKSLKNCQMVNVHVSETEVMIVVRKSKEPIPAPTSKTAAVIRYGAYGDLMRASAVCAGLKKQGYWVVMHCSYPSAEILEQDPNINEFVYTDRDQVRNSDLGDYWNYQKTLYDKWVNLCEAEEGILLEMTGPMNRPGPQWGPKLREKFKSYNYLQFQEEIAEVPHAPENIKFFPTLEEKQWARKERDKIKYKKVILWQFEGSSVNKVWSGEIEGGFDQALARIMLAFDDVAVVITGGKMPSFKFDQWENEPRFINKRGEWTMRQTLSFLNEVDMVIGPETGTVNAACNLPIPKVVFLSHSVVENLTRDWVNTTSLIAPNVKCKGRGNNEAMSCHQIHYGWDSCTQNEKTGTAECQANITIDMWWDAVDAWAIKLGWVFTDYYKNLPTKQ